MSDIFDHAGDAGTFPLGMHGDCHTPSHVSPTKTLVTPTALRPSALPKLAECPRYQSEADAGAAADRGTQMDSAFRAILLGTHVGWVPDVNREDAAAVEWAVMSARLFAGNSLLLAAEADLAVKVMGMTGTADCACPDKQWSGDLKSGQIRNYLEQQAAYALGFMDREFCDEWTVHLFFCDERQIVTHHFTRESAESAIRPVIAEAKDPLAMPRTCEYCGWCALRWSCAARLEPLSMLLTGAPDNLDLTAIKDCPADLGRLMEITYEIAKDDGLHDVLKRAAAEHLERQIDVPGWKLQAGRETKTLPSARILTDQGRRNLLRDAGTAKLIEVLGNISAKKSAELWLATYSEPMPDDFIQTNHGSAFVAKAGRKKKAANK